MVFPRYLAETGKVKEKHRALRFVKETLKVKGFIEAQAKGVSE